MKRYAIGVLAGLALLVTGEARGAPIYATNVTRLLRGDTGVGDLPGFYGGNIFSFPVALTAPQAESSILGAPDSRFLSLPGRDDTPSGAGFPYAYAELEFGVDFMAAGTTLTLWEPGDNGETALLWLNVDGGGFIHAEAQTNAAGKIDLDLSPFQSILDSAYGGAKFISVGIGGLDELGASKGFDLDAVAITSTPEPATYALVSAGLIGMGLFRRRRR